MMTFNKFINSLESIPKIHENINLFYQEWGRDLPVMLCGNIGRFISKNFDYLSANEIALIFDLIKQAMETTGQDIDIYVATGLLESMYNSAQENGNWQYLSKKLDDNSKRYIANWLNQ